MTPSAADQRVPERPMSGMPLPSRGDTVGLIGRVDPHVVPCHRLPSRPRRAPAAPGWPARSAARHVEDCRPPSSACPRRRRRPRRPAPRPRADRAWRSRPRRRENRSALRWLPCASAADRIDTFSSSPIR